LGGVLAPCSAAPHEHPSAPASFQQNPNFCIHIEASFALGFGACQRNHLMSTAMFLVSDALYFLLEAKSERVADAGLKDGRACKVEIIGKLLISWNSGCRKVPQKGAPEQEAEQGGALRRHGAADTFCSHLLLG
jgi:hypothetical protein